MSESEPTPAITPVEIFDSQNAPATHTAFSDPITPGDWAAHHRHLGDVAVWEFARASGDHNRLHLSDDYADQTRFGERIVHGGLVQGTVSAAIAAYPGTPIYFGQEAKFINPVPVGSTVTAVARVTESVDDRQYRMSTPVYCDDETVLEGETTVLLDPEPDSVQGDDR